MKRFILSLLIASFCAPLLLAQEEPPIPPPRRMKEIKMGFFAGFTPGWLFLDVDPLNQVIVSSRGAALKDDGVFLWGGGGAAYIMFIPNLRIGGVGMSGLIKSTSLDAQNLRRDANLDVSFGGVTIEYVIPLVDRLDIAIGGMVGTGGLDLTLRQNNGGNNRWEEEWNFFGGNPTANINNLTRKLSGSYFVWIPGVNVEYALLGWVGLRLGASYVGMSSPSWKVDDTYDLLGVPDAVNGKGFMINAGLFVGTF